MKKIIAFLFLVLLAVAMWLVLRQTKLTSQSAVPSPPPSTTNVGMASSPLIVPAKVMPSTNVFIRPDYIDEDQWNRLMFVRQSALMQNQPVEFYARIEDGSGNPVEGAQLQITLSRIDEKMFETTNFFHMNMGDEIVHIQLKLLSDAGGWIRVTNMTGKALWVESLSKDGYLWKLPQIDSFAYEPNGHRTVGYAGMEDAFDPTKGYIFHLQKIEGK